MIVSKNINIKVSCKTITKLRSLGYDVKINDIISIPIEHLDNGSHIKVDVKCEICGLEKSIMYQKYLKNIKNCGIYACNSKCAQFKVKKTSLEKFGKEYYRQTDECIKRIEDTNIERYGSKSPFGSDYIKSIIIKTNLEKYGSENPFGSKLIQEKIYTTNLEKYGSENPSKNRDVRNKISDKLSESWQNKFKNYYNGYLNIKSYDVDKNYTISCDLKEDHDFIISNTLLHNRKQLKTTLCTLCNPSESRNTSGHELKLREFIESFYSGKIVYNDRGTISPYELDIYLPDLNIAIEFNGLYWHSEIKKDNNYHLTKHNSCRDKEIELVQIFEDDWIYKNDIVKSIIKNKIVGSSNIVYARSCYIKEVCNKESNDFLKKSHIQGSINGKINIGLYYKDELITLMVFGSLRKSLGNKSKSKNYELLRYCNKLDYSVIGGGSKILKFFIKNYEFNELTTYYDKSFGYKNLYEKIGFKFNKETKPNYFYIVNGIKKHRYGYRKDILVKSGYDKNKTEREIMLDRKIYRIYNSGNIKYSLVKSENFII
jgi:hypothetical protein